MVLTRGLLDLQPDRHGCVATIGNFDGLHRGHLVVLDQLAEKAAELRLPATVISFEPHPQEFFRPDRAPARLTPLREKIEGLNALAVDRFVVLRFDRRLAEVAAEDFVDTVLVRGLAVRFLVIGDDFRFGRGRCGDFRLLEELGRRHGFAVAHTRSFEIDGERVSSSAVRAALVAGDLPRVARLLGRRYSLSGRVVRGDRRGRTIGFPTANVPLRRRISPVRGVYAVSVDLGEGEMLGGVANIGTRPTIRGGGRPLLEVHLFDFDRDLYGRRLRVELLERLRDERCFSSLAELHNQIQVDAEQAKGIVGAVPPLHSPARIEQVTGGR